MKRAKVGDRESLIRLVMDSRDEYYKLAFVYMGNKDDSLDVLSEMILILWDNIGRLKDEKAFYSWSKTILVNCCKKHLKKRKKVISIDEVREISVDQRLETREQRIDIDNQLSSLNRMQQEAIRLHYYLDWDYQTIAQHTGVPEGTVKSRISLGLKKLKESFGGEY